MIGGAGSNSHLYLLGNREKSCSESNRAACWLLRSFLLTCGRPLSIFLFSCGRWVVPIGIGGEGLMGFAGIFRRFGGALKGSDRFVHPCGVAGVLAGPCKQIVRGRIGLLVREISPQDLNRVGIFLFSRVDLAEELEGNNGRPIESGRLG